MKTCSVWPGLSIASDSRDETRRKARTYLRSEGGRFNYLWLFQNLRDGIERKVSLEALRSAAFKQRKVEAREPNWNRIQVLRRLYQSYESDCSEAFTPNVRLADGNIEFQSAVIRKDRRTGEHKLVMPQPRRLGINVIAVLPMLFYCARRYLLVDAREQLLPATPESHIGIEVPDLGSDDPRYLKYLREAQIFSEGNAPRIEAHRAEERLAHFAEVWPEEAKRVFEEEQERKRSDRRRDDPWPSGSLFNQKK